MHDPHSHEMYQEAMSLHRRGYNPDEISGLLLGKGAAEHLVQDIVGRLRSRPASDNRTRGFWFLGIGSFLLAAGFLLTLVLFNAHGMRFCMYGLTTIGVVLVMKGLADIMGW